MYRMPITNQGADFFDGEPADISWYPPDTDEKGKKLGEFFNNQAAPPKTLERIPKILDELESKHGIKEWGILGYCWGGKIVNLSSQEGTRFKSAVSCHPAMVDENDAPGIKIPFAMLPSGDEPKEDVEKWQKAVKVKNIVRWYEKQLHGFMAARSDLKDENVKKAYEDAYKVVLVSSLFSPRLKNANHLAPNLGLVPRHAVSPPFSATTSAFRVLVWIIALAHKSTRPGGSSKL